MSNETNPNQILIKVWDVPTSPPLHIEFIWKLGSDSKYHGTCRVKEPIPVAFPTTYLYGQKFIFSWGYLDSCGFRIRWCFNENGLKDWDPITSYQEGVDEVERFIKEIGYGYILEYQNEKIDEMADLFQGKKKACFTLNLDPPLEIEVIDRATKNNKYPIVYIKEDEGLESLPAVELSPIFIGEELTPDWGYPDPKQKGTPYHDAFHSKDDWDIFRYRAKWRGRVWFGLFDSCIKDIDKWLATYFPSITISQTIVGSGNIHILDNSSVVSSPATKKEEETNKTARFLVQLNKPTEFLIVDKASKDGHPIVYVSYDQNSAIPTMCIKQDLCGESFNSGWGYYNEGIDYVARTGYYGRVYQGSFEACYNHVKDFLNKIDVSWTLQSKESSNPPIKAKPKLDLLEDNVERINDKVNYSSLLARKTLTENQTLPRKMTFEERVLSRLDELKERMDRLEKVVLSK